MQTTKYIPKNARYNILYYNENQLPRYITRVMGVMGVGYLIKEALER